MLELLCRAKVETSYLLPRSFIPSTISPFVIADAQKITSPLIISVILYFLSKSFTPNFKALFSLSSKTSRVCI